MNAKIVATLFLLAGIALIAFSCFREGQQDVLRKWESSQKLADNAARVLEESWQHRYDRAQETADERVKDVISGAAVSADNSKRLHVAAISAQQRACQTSTSAARREEAGKVLADVLGRVAERTGELAAYADRLRIGLDQCRGAWPR